jgi:hypothetical protein
LPFLRILQSLLGYPVWEKGHSRTGIGSERKIKI